MPYNLAAESFHVKKFCSRSTSLDPNATENGHFVFLSTLPGPEALRAMKYLLEIAVFWRMESLLSKILGKWGHPPQIILPVIKLDDSWYKNIARSCYVSQCTRSTDAYRSMDGQTDAHRNTAAAYLQRGRNWLTLHSKLWKSTYMDPLSGCSPQTKCLLHS